MSSRTGVTRRDAVRLGAVGVVGVLAGCAGGGGGGGGGDGGDGGAAGGGDGGSGSGGSGGSGGGDGSGAGGGGVDALSAVVGELTDLGPIGMAVLAMERRDGAPLLGTVDIPAQEGNEYLAVDVAFTNASDRYLSLVVDLFAAAVGEGVYDSAEPFADVLSPELGGLPFAPGELQRRRLHFEVPEGSTDARLRAILRVRSLPDTEYQQLTPLQVDLESTTASPARLSQSFSVPFESLGQAVTHEGIELTLRDAVTPVEVPGRTPTAGHEFVALDLSVTNGGDLPNPILVSLGGFGGISLGDGDGNLYTRAIPFNGEVAGSRRFDPSNGIAPGETESGVAIGEVPAGTTPLYVTWSPPAAYWQPGRTSRRNRYVWQLR